MVPYYLPYLNDLLMTLQTATLIAVTTIALKNSTTPKPHLRDLRRRLRDRLIILIEYQQTLLRS